MPAGFSLRIILLEIFLNGKFPAPAPASLRDNCGTTVSQLGPQLSHSCDHSPFRVAAKLSFRDPPP